ncbi:hypothetical protein BSL78_05674 [Apostichopus japonicus]|uniref:Uncharacterized protein n=1 Tax=Stichopus japonicus TaxID=307972 RepID=A0A2G8LAW2_STIJA|nr:hypothetical protein BSL78_05674 [Apostichopus japonicus]
MRYFGHDIPILKLGICRLETSGSAVSGHLEDPNVMAQQFVKSVLTDVSIPPLSITTDLGYKGTIYADIHNFRTTNVNPGEAASLAKVSPDSIALATPGMTFDVTADWNVQWRKYL